LGRGKKIKEKQNILVNRYFFTQDLVSYLPQFFALFYFIPKHCDDVHFKKANTAMLGTDKPVAWARLYPQEGPAPFALGGGGA
jgi:hypothetical protein